jgi:hypothetical protein
MNIEIRWSLVDYISDFKSVCKSVCKCMFLYVKSLNLCMYVYVFLRNTYNIHANDYIQNLHT